MNKEGKRLQKELLAGRSVIVETVGVSMEPLLHDKKKKNATHVLIVPCADQYHIGDMPLVLFEDGRYILHRVVGMEEVQGELRYITRGDNCVSVESVAPGQILGMVQEIYYPRRTVRVTDRIYRVYVWMWMRTFLLRRIHKKIQRFSANLLKK